MRFGLAFASVLLLGCAHVGALKEKAGRDLSCPADEVKVLDDGKTREVEACGKRAVYHWTGAHWLRQDKDKEKSPESSPEQKAATPPPRKEEWQ